MRLAPLHLEIERISREAVKRLKRVTEEYEKMFRKQQKSQCTNESDM